MSSLNDMFSARISTDFSRKLGGGEGGEESVTPPVPTPFSTSRLMNRYLKATYE